MNFQKNLPGESLHFTMLRMFTFHSNYACKTFSSITGDIVSPTYSMNVFIGCPPYQTIETNWNYTLINNYCNNADPGIPCSYFDDGKFFF